VTWSWPGNGLLASPLAVGLVGIVYFADGFFLFFPV
jgi:hypothetical protein